MRHAALGRGGGAEDAEEVAVFIEESLIRAFDKWPDAEAELCKIAEV